MWSCSTPTSRDEFKSRLAVQKIFCHLSSHIVLQIRRKIANLNLADDASDERRARVEGAGTVREYVRNTHAFAWQAPFA